ncbi:MAG: hypothetical protein WKF61_01115 [Luteimonas sp.]
MVAFVAPSNLETQFSGQYGNAAVATGAYSPNAAAVNDTVKLITLYAGTKITGVRLCNGANGATTTVDLGLQNCDGTAGPSLTQFFALQATSAAASSVSASRPVMLLKDAFVVATFKGATTSVAGAGNYIEAIVDYEFRGA